MFNPFGPPIIDAVLYKIATKPKHLVYINPVHETVVQGHGAFREINRFRLMISVMLPASVGKLVH